MSQRPAEAAADGRAAARIRAYTDRDFDHVVEQWHPTNRASYPYVRVQQEHTLAGARRFFAENVVPACELWVAEANGEPIGVVALVPPRIRQLAVFAPFRRLGVGSALLQQVRARSPAGLRLYTFQRNTVARAFYETHGFVVVALGVSPAPESEPDVEYRWSP